MELLKKIWDWCKDEDWVVVAIPGIILSIFLSMYGLWFWFWMFAVIGGLVVGTEMIAMKMTGLSISDQFRTWKKTHRRASWAVLLAAALFFASLLFHLMVEIK